MRNIPSKNMVNNANGTDVLVVERYFGESIAVTFEGIITSLIQEKVDQYVNESYHHDTVNAATSDEGVA